MKTKVFFLLLISAALSACASTPASAAPKPKRALAYRVSIVRQLNEPSVELGATRYEVLSWMGRPLREVSPDLWIYAHYHADFAQANRDGCELILVTFTGNAVSDLKIANQSAAEIYAASATARQQDQIASGKK